MYQHPIEGPFTRVRISWTEGKEALDKNIEVQGLSIYDIPVFVELGECQYDMAVAVSSLDKFEEKYGCKIMHSFTLSDPLCKSRSWLETIEKVIERYDEAILAGAWGGMVVWLENQKSQFQGLKTAFIQATEI